MGSLTPPMTVHFNGPFQQIIMSEHDNDLDNTEVKSCDFAHI